MKEKFLRSLVYAILAFVFIASLYAMIDDDSFMYKRFMGDDSGRGDIRESIFSFMSFRGDITNMLIGFGFNACRLMVGIYAHNDFIEVLFNYGILGTLSHLFMLIMFVASSLRIPTNCVDRYIAFISVGIWILMALTSATFFYPQTVFLTIALGCIFGKYNNKQKI